MLQLRHCLQKESFTCTTFVTTLRMYTYIYEGYVWIYVETMCSQPRSFPRKNAKMTKFYEYVKKTWRNVKRGLTALCCSYFSCFASQQFKVIEFQKYKILNHFYADLCSIFFGTLLDYYFYCFIFLMSLIYKAIFY